MKKYRTSRFKQLIFPQELLIDKFHVLARKRHFPAFWIVTEESIPLSKLASIQIQRGFLFSKLIIENSGGPYPIVVDGLWNRAAHDARDLLEMIERETQSPEDIGALLGEGGDRHDSPPPSPPNPGGPSGSGRSGPSEKRNSPNRAVAISPVFGHAQPCKSQANQPTCARADYRPVSADTPQLDFEFPRRVGEIPGEDWNPAPPWAPRATGTVVSQPETLECNPLNFAMEEPPVATAIDEPTRIEERFNPVEQITNWWENAKTSFKLPDMPLRNRRRRKLN
jgi:hypothetical protein